MKRAFPQKVESVSCHPLAIDAMVVEPKRVLPEANRRARTSAAMIGLALSMGASSLLLPKQTDGAAAAEPRATESTVSSSLAVTEHVVQEGQTLWQISQRYSVSPAAIAAVNNIDSASILRVGQTLRIPIANADSMTRSQARSIRPSSTVASTRLQVAEPSAPAMSEDVLKTRQVDALSRMRQQRERLRGSLAELRTEESQALDGSAAEQLGSSSSQRFSMPEETGVAYAPPGAATEPAKVSSAEWATAESSKSAVPTAAELVTYQVKPGDTLVAIARSYGVSQQTLADINQISDPSQLQVNQSLAIPQDAPLALGNLSPSPAVNQDLEVFPEPVAPALSEPALSEPEAPSERGSVVYQVNPGDTISDIAQAHGIARSALLSANQITNPNMIWPGQKIEIPVGMTVKTEVETPVLSSGDSTSGVVVPLDMSLATADVPQSSSTSGLGPVPVELNVDQVPMVSLPVIPSSAVVAASPDGSTLMPEMNESLSGLKSPNGEVVDKPQDVAAAPYAQPQSTEERSDQIASASTQPSSSPYVQSLMAEIMSLRDSYRAESQPEQVQASEVEEPVVVASAPTPSPSTLAELPQTSGYINPEFRPDRYTEAFQSQIRRLQQEHRDQATQPSGQVEAQAAVVVPEVQPSAAGDRPVDTQSADASAPQNEEQLLAVAPLGSQNYQPLTQPITGRMVSPDLPPLPGAEAFLPDGSSVAFDGYIWPARGVLTSGYGWRWGRMHRGIDIGAPVGTPVMAAAAGVVQYSGWNSGGYGNMVEIRHPDGSVTRYAHHSRNLVRVGQEVDQGEQIAEVGSTGYSTGPHLHFEVHLPSQGTVNPIAYLPR